MSENRFVKNRPEVDGLTKRRFFYRQGSDIYGGSAGFYTYGPPGCAIKNNLFSLWRQHFVVEENMMEIEDTCVMPERPLKASGHVDKFTDFLVKDSGNLALFWRADKLLEEMMEKKIEEEKDAAKKKEMQIVLNSADGYSADELVEIFEKYNIRAPNSGNKLTKPEPFNLMFPTPIGPVGGEQGYLRPETAQGIFLNYKFCKEQNSERMPFGIAQIGKVFRNEIAPRAGLTRQREFQQAEIEWFIKPEEYAHPKWNEVKDMKITLFSAAAQESGDQPQLCTLQDALAKGIIKDNNETMGYFIGRTFDFLVKAGCNANHLRFRQHMSTEMAHYACDCWDAESETSYGWLEIVGIANRSAFDLTAHSKATGQDLQVRETLKEPIDVEKTEVTKEAIKELMKHFKKDGKAVKEALEALEYKVLKGMQEQADGGNNPKIAVGDQVLEIPHDKLKTTSKMTKVTTIAYTPSVIEPSFGVDRVLFTIFEHSYTERPKDETSAAQTRGFLNLPANMAPYKYTILPVDQRITRDPAYQPLVSRMKREFSRLNCAGSIDDSGATIGKRYARNDELGVPFAITFDNKTLTDGLATVRERNTVRQISVHVDEIPALLDSILKESTSWDDALKKYPEVANAATQLVGVMNTN